MPFKTDGSSHAGGIANELSACKFLQTQSTVLRSFLCPAGETVRHLGGTTTKKDLEIVDAAGEIKGVSVKNHGIKGGTFDWANMTAELPVTIRTTLDAAIRQIVNDYNASTKTTVDVEAVRTKCNDLFAANLRALSSDTIRQLLKAQYTKCPPYILINHAKQKAFVAAEREKNLKELATYEDWSYFLKSTPRAKTSAQIWRRGPDGAEVNTHLRLRLVLNNGVTALLGTSEANASSTPCLKIQQDAVDKFIETLVDPVRESYSELA